MATGNSSDIALMGRATVLLASPAADMSRRVADSSKLSQMATSVPRHADPRRRLAYCGQPLSRNGQPGSTLRRIGSGTHSETDNYLEDWVYDLGGDSLYVMHLRNGHAESVEHVRR